MEIQGESGYTELCGLLSPQHHHAQFIPPAELLQLWLPVTLAWDNLQQHISGDKLESLEERKAEISTHFLLSTY